MSIADERVARLKRETPREMSPRRGFTGAARSLADIWQRRDLLNLLVHREIRARYKDSTLGLLWSLVRPLTQLLIYYFVMGRFLGAAKGIPDFAIYIFTGLTAWTLFSEIITVGTGSIVSNSGIIKKIKLPREIFPLASVGSALFNFVLQSVILLAAALFIRGLNWTAVWYVPLSIAVLLVWATALGLFLSAVNVYLRDVQYIVEVAMMIGFWVSPIVYSWEMVRREAGALFASIYACNPVTLAIMGVQQGMWKAGSAAMIPSHLGLRLLAVLIVGLVALFLAQRAFDRMQSNFAQEI